MVIEILLRFHPKGNGFSDPMKNQYGRPRSARLRGGDEVGIEFAAIFAWDGDVLERNPEIFGSLRPIGSGGEKFPGRDPQHDVATACRGKQGQHYAKPGRSA